MGELFFPILIEKEGVLFFVCFVSLFFKRCIIRALSSTTFQNLLVCVE